MWAILAACSLAQSLLIVGCGSVTPTMTPRAVPTPTSTSLAEPTIHSQLRGDSPTCEVYDVDDDHLWNRLFCALYGRIGPGLVVHGLNELDTLHWSETKHLIYGASHDKAIAVLDEFLAKHGEGLITDTVKRAFLQRDLWAIFDWLQHRDDEGTEYEQVRAQLQSRLVEVMRRLALSEQEIRALPDNYVAAVRSESFDTQFAEAKPEQAYLPNDLFDQESGWVLLGGGKRPLADTHVSSEMGARSVWLVFIRVPNGRIQTQSFSRQLAAAADLSNPPQIPPGTEVALLRRTLLIDNQGVILPSPITEELQIRHYMTGEPKSQSFFELRLLREQLFNGKAGGLRIVGGSDRSFVSLNPGGEDPIETISSNFGTYDKYEGSLILGDCIQCHGSTGSLSIQSYSQNVFRMDNPPMLLESTVEIESANTVRSKMRQTEWNELKTLWRDQ